MALEEGRFFTGSMSDRRHNADGLAEYFRDVFTSGVWVLDNNLIVTPGTGMTITINYGKALVDGYPYRLLDNGTGLKVLSIGAADTQPRIDRVVIRKDVSAQRVYAFIKKGTPAEAPVPPMLEQSETIYEISLAQISVPIGLTEITSGNLTDERELVGFSKTIKLSGHGVNSYYISDNSTSPALIFGGVWTRIKDLFLLAAGDIYAAGMTGGEAQHILTNSELPASAYNSGNIYATTPGAGSAPGVAVSGGAGEVNWWASNLGGGQAHNNMPPYKAVYIWKRTA